MNDQILLDQIESLKEEVKRLRKEQGFWHNTREFLARVEPEALWGSAFISLLFALVVICIVALGFVIFATHERQCDFYPAYGQDKTVCIKQVVRWDDDRCITPYLPDNPANQYILLEVMKARLAACQLEREP